MAKVLIATYSRSGQTKGLAQEIKQLVGNADMYEIAVPDGTFDRDMYRTDEIATEQIKNNDFPQLVNSIPDLEDYDLILVGSPVWRGRPATPVHTFLNLIQGFDGKIASFYTDAGAPGNYESIFKNWAGDLTVLPAHEGPNDLSAWIKKLN